MEKTERMKKLVARLNEASMAYYQQAREIMSDMEYDGLYDELAALEEETGIVLASSPTQNVGFEVLSGLVKEEHTVRMLSLDKTKDRDSLATWLGDRKGLLSWKLDGLTIVLTYENGELVKALTRGDGNIGEVVTGNAKTFKNLPVTIPYKGRLVLRGEAVITYSDFRKINERIEDVDAKYKNPRNLCSGSVRQLDPKITAGRNVHFLAFALVEAGNGPLSGASENNSAKETPVETISNNAAGATGSGTPDFHNSNAEKFRWLKEQGFEVVEYREVSGETVVENVQWFRDRIEKNDFPSDGLVLLMDDIEYGRALGNTAKFPRNAIAFKWADRREETTLKGIEWSTSRTGLVNPIALFDPVQLEGTTVSRASLHNISIMEELELGIGDRLLVYKANMIIPQIAENLTKSGNIKIPGVCPVCREKTGLRSENGVKTLHCLNADCPAKRIKSFALFVSRNAMDIEGLSEATLQKFISRGIVKEFADLFRLQRHKEEIVSMEGFGEKSYRNLIASAEKASHTSSERLLYALGIDGIGAANAKLISSACDGKWARIESLTVEDLVGIDGIGEVMADAFVRYFADNAVRKSLDLLMRFLDIDESGEEKEDFFDGLTFVITGALTGYGNRGELKAAIERAGGKVSGSVSARTDYLINNDVKSASGKNKKAIELGIKIIDERTVTRWLDDGGVPAGK